MAVTGDLRATIEQVEENLFRANYPGELNPTDADAARLFPDAHIGTRAAGVKSWVEQMAASLGYRRVIWE